MPTLVLPPRFTQDSIALWRAAGRLGWETERLQTWRVPFDLSDQTEVVLYGGLAFIIAPELGITLLEPPLDWLARVPREYRGREVAATTLGEARRWPRRAFIKPADDKCFVAAVYEPGALQAHEVLPEATPVVVSEPVAFGVEFRTFVLDRRVRTLSPYLRAGTRVETDDGEWPAGADEFREAQEFAARVAADARVPLPPAVVLDVGRIGGGEWAVVEVNPAWGSGVYGCEPEEVLHVIRRACVPRVRLTEEDRRWVNSRA